MTIETYNKRFDLPVHYLAQLFMPIVRAKSGKWYQIVLNKNGLPVARLITHHLPEQEMLYVKGLDYPKKKKPKVFPVKFTAKLMSADEVKSPPKIKFT